MLMTTDDLSDALGTPDLVVADASWFLPGDARDAAAEFRAEHVPGAVFLDLAGLADPASPLPMTLPPPALFAAALGALGIGEDTRVVLYDDSPHHTAARAWAMFRSFGREAVVLDGGLAKWRAEGRAVETGEVATEGFAAPAVATARVGVADLGDVARALRTGAGQVIDARSPSRFAGEEPEPRPGVVPGHMPGAVNLHYARFFRGDGTWKREDELRALFVEAGVDPERPVIATCGSGVTAGVLVFALALLGQDAAFYDGSWAEWGGEADTPKVTGR